MDQSPDEDVAAAFSSGQPDALALVYQRFGALVYSIALRSLRAGSEGHTGTFIIPPGTDLHNYSRIDISLQPFDGSTQHSKTSVVRGSLPAAALGGTAAPR